MQTEDKKIYIKDSNKDFGPKLSEKDKYYY